jgi:hypothetical protein
MNVWGHVALAHSLATRRPWGMEALKSRALPLIVGALLPDIIDKTLMIAEVYPWGRTVGHSAYVLTLFALISLLAKREWFTWLVAGWVSHMFADFTDDVVVAIQATRYVFAAWYTWPYFNPDMFAVQVEPIHPARTCLSVYETFVTFWAIVSARVLVTARRWL